MDHLQTNMDEWRPPPDKFVIQKKKHKAYFHPLIYANSVILFWKIEYETYRQL